MSNIPEFPDEALLILISQKMLQQLLTLKSVDYVDEFSIQLKSGHICVQGKIKRVVPIFFYIQLKPVQAQDRKLLFKVVKIKPVSFNLLRKQIMNHLPAVSYHNNHLTLDLNQIRNVKNIPFGNIQSFHIKDDALWLQIGV